MSGRYLTEDEIDTKIAGGGGELNVVAVYFINGIPDKIEYTLMIGSPVITGVSRTLKGAYGITHNMNTKNYMVVPIGMLNNNGLPCNTSIGMLTSEIFQIRISNSTQVDGSFYLLIFK